jgi:hypothetical protein
MTGPVLMEMTGSGGDMAENRFKKRHRKRFSLHFGIDRAEKLGFTDDITHDGLFIRSAAVVKPGGTIKIEIMPPQGGLIAILGEVCWAKKVPPNVLHKLKGGMGVQIKSFLAGEEIYHALCDELVEKRGV